LYTQCPDCSTVFRVSAEALRAAQGRVRCGICSAGFDALDNLSEAPIARALGEAPEVDTITVEELPGNEFIELSAAGLEAEEDSDAPAEDAATDEESDQDASTEEITAEPRIIEPEEADGEAADAAACADEAPTADDAGGDEFVEAPPSAPARDESESPGADGTGESPAGEERGGEAPVEHVASSGEAPGNEAAEAQYGAKDSREEDDGEEGSGADTADAMSDSALEFHGSAEDLERLFVPAGTHIAGGEPALTDISQGIEDIAEQDLSGIEVREEELIWPASLDGPFDPGNPAHIAAVLASSSGSLRKGREDDVDGAGERPAPEAGDDEIATAQDDEPAAEPGPDGPGADSATEPDGDDGRDETPPLLIIPEELRRGPSATAADELAAPLDLEADTPRRWPLAVAAALLALVLAAQAVHHWRFDLARNPVSGPWILRTYQAVGIDLPHPVDLGAFELRQLGAASDPGQAGRIRVRASIVNHASFAQPYPLLRLTLQDRFGSTIGARNLAPEEYLPGAAVDASGLLGASQRADAEVVFVDPGREAVGFELDLCAEGDSGLRCSADLPRTSP